MNTTNETTPKTKGATTPGELQDIGFHPLNKRQQFVWYSSDGQLPPTGIRGSRIKVADVTHDEAAGIIDLLELRLDVALDPLEGEHEGDDKDCGGS